jgi:hypothetical protein
MIHKGSCHCGKIKIEVEADLRQAIACNCSHCAKKGYVLAFVPRASFRLLTAEADVSTYTFNKHAIRHHFCAGCGCAPYAEGADPAGKATAAINLRCLDDIDLAQVEITPVDGRSF